MSERPHVSVVVPTFRRPTQVAEAVRSVLSQTGVRVEVLVLDDSSEGSARSTIEALGDSRVTYRHRQPVSQGNPARVRNEGLADTRGAVVHFLDDDDIVAPGVYSAALDAFARNASRGVVFGRIEPFGDAESSVLREGRLFATSERRARRLRHSGRFPVVAAELFAEPTLFVNSACMIRREVALRIDGYDEAIRVMEDVDFYTRAIRESGFVFLDRVVIRYRTGYPSLMNAAQQRDVYLAFERMYDKYRAAHGATELLFIKILAKSLIRWT
jgi:glycosyltransferase involved in cell wall biosynthesis